MSDKPEEIKEEAKKVLNEEPKVPEKRTYAEGRGRYTVLEGTKASNFDFPITSSLEDNFSILAFLKDEVLKAIEAKDKADLEKKENKEKQE